MNEERIAVDFFLGSMTPNGFRGYFEELSRWEDRKLYLIKGGPGCGKSTLMKKLTRSGRGPLERIHCSGDPDSLDGVCLEQPRCAVVDATAPHVLEPSAPGAAEDVVSLYHTLNAGLLVPHRCEILELFRTCAQLQAQARQCISGAAGLLMCNRRIAALCTDFDKVNLFAARFARRILPRASQTGGAKTGRAEIRLLSAVTPKGLLFFRETVPRLADKIWVLQDETGAASCAIMDYLCKYALEHGHNFIICPCSISDSATPEHLIFPQLRLAVLTSNTRHPLCYPGQHNIRCRRFFVQSLAKHSKVKLRFNRKAAGALLCQAVEHQQEAKAIHDRLEEYYKAAVDFARVDLIYEKVAARIEADFS